MEETHERIWELYEAGEIDIRMVNFFIVTSNLSKDFNLDDYRNKSTGKIDVEKLEELLN